jgi:inward rectifier potassium channel
MNPTPTPGRLSARLLPRQGRRQIRSLGLRRRRFSDLFHFVLDTRWSTLLVLVSTLYVTINALFAGLYLLDPRGLENARPGSFEDAFFFSVQTLATIGYGKLVPRTTYVNVLVTLEAFMGLIGFAVVTGLIFTKFARPTARVLFSDLAVVAPRDGQTSLMFRMANERANNIAEAELHVVLAVNEITREGESVRRFYDLALQRQRSALFALTWTAVHPITTDSPLHGRTPAQLATADAEVIVSFVGIDDTFAQPIHSRFAYPHDHLRWDHRFVDILTFGADGVRQIDYTHFHDVEPLPGVAPRAAPGP